MKIVSLSCPKCGGKLDDVKIADGKSDLFCNYCGNHILLENENHQVFEHRTVDEARIKELELELEKFRDDKQKRKLLLMLGGACLIGGVLFIILGELFKPLELLSLFGMLLLMIAMIFVMMAFDKNDKKKESSELD